MLERAANMTGNLEERWFTMLKLGEINERYYNNWNEAERWYLECTKNDSARADPFFYLGQHFRLVGAPERALGYLESAASLPVPERSLFLWHFLYNCLSKVEYARAVAMIDPSDTSVDQEKIVNQAIKFLRQTRGCDDALESEKKSLLTSLETRSQLHSTKSDGDSIAVVTQGGIWLCCCGDVWFEF